MVKSDVGYISDVLVGKDPEGRFRVPDASATPYSLYGPRGVFVKDNIFIVADTGNHRVLIWYSIPKKGQPADIVLGQPDFFTDSINAGGDTQKGLYMPTGIFVTEDNKLLIADAWNHRILLWEKLPESNFQKPDHVIGQPDLLSVEKGMFFWPFGVYMKNNTLFICDTGNRRVLSWKGIPDSIEPPENIHSGFMWPHTISANKDYIFLADAGTGISKVYMYKSCIKNKNSYYMYFGEKEGCGKRNLNLPYGVSVYKDLIAIADTSNNRVLLFYKNIKNPFLVLGQYSFEECGENRWEGVKPDSLCWPYAVFINNNNVYVADTGNNRILLFKLNGEVNKNVPFNTL